MARHEQDREDLLREATALAERIELRLPGFAEHVVIGFRRNGAASIYLGGDPVFQFNTSGELRRAFLNGRLIKAEGGRLIWLERQRTEEEVILLRREFTTEEQSQFLQLVVQHLTALRVCLTNGSYFVVGLVPAESELVKRVSVWLESLPTLPRIALAPHTAH